MEVTDCCRDESEAVTLAQSISHDTIASYRFSVFYQGCLTSICPTSHVNVLAIRQAWDGSSGNRWQTSRGEVGNASTSAHTLSKSIAVKFNSLLCRANETDESGLIDESSPSWHHG